MGMISCTGRLISVNWSFKFSSCLAVMSCSDQEYWWLTDRVGFLCLPLQWYPCLMTPHSYKHTKTRDMSCFFLTQFDWPICVKPETSIRMTHKASTRVAERRPLVCGFMEVMCVIEVVAQLGTHRHSPHEVRGDFLTADLSLSKRNIFQQQQHPFNVMRWFVFVNGCHDNMLFLYSFLTCQFPACRRRRGSWLLFFQSPPVKCSRPGSGRSFSLWTAGGAPEPSDHSLVMQQFF